MCVRQIWARAAQSHREWTDSKQWVVGMHDLGQLLSYYPHRADARSAVQALRRKGFKRLALLIKSGDGRVLTLDASTELGSSGPSSLVSCLVRAV